LFMACAGGPDARLPAAAMTKAKPADQSKAVGPTEVPLLEGMQGKARATSLSAVETVSAVAVMALLSSVPAASVLSWLPAMSTLHDLLSMYTAAIRAWGPLPMGGLEQFRMLWCGWIAFALLRFHPAQARFYRWFAKSGTCLSEKRGFGYTGCRAFGLFSMPHLAQWQFHLCLFLMVGSLILAACPFFPSAVTRASLLSALVMYLLYFSQLFCESRAAGHATIIIPLVLIHLACAPQTSTWPILMLKVHMAICYFSAGYGKIALSIRFGKFWGDGTAQQYLFWECMWSRPGGRLSQTLQEFLFRRLWLSQLLSVGTLVFQLGAPFTLLDLRISWFFFVLSFGFHAGVLLTSNISFMPYWVPALIIFIFPHGRAPFDGAWDSAAFALEGAWDSAPIGFACVCTYLLLQLVVTLGLVDLTFGDVLPLSCEPMFVLPRSLHDKWPKLMVLTSADCREAGHLEPYVHCTFNPLSSVFLLDEKAMAQLPSKTLLLITMSSVPEELKLKMRADISPAPYWICSNVPIDDAFRLVLAEIAEILSDGEHSAIRDAKKLDRLVKLQKQSQKAFDRACLISPAEVKGYVLAGAEGKSML